LSIVLQPVVFQSPPALVTFPYEDHSLDFFFFDLFPLPFSLERVNFASTGASRRGVIRALTGELLEQIIALVLGASSLLSPLPVVVVL